MSKIEAKTEEEKAAATTGTEETAQHFAPVGNELEWQFKIQNRVQKETVESAQKQLHKLKHSEAASAVTPETKVGKYGNFQKRWEKTTHSKKIWATSRIRGGKTSCAGCVEGTDIFGVTAPNKKEQQYVGSAKVEVPGYSQMQVTVGTNKEHVMTGGSDVRAKYNIHGTTWFVGGKVDFVCSCRCSRFCKVVLKSGPGQWILASGSLSRGSGEKTVFVTPYGLFPVSSDAIWSHQCSSYISAPNGKCYSRGPFGELRDVLDRLKNAGLKIKPTPLFHLTENHQAWNWTLQCNAAFFKLKESLVTSPVLAYPVFSIGFVVDTDASGEGLGAVLSQNIEGHDHVISYASRTLNKAERKYCATRREMLALVWAIQHFRAYLYGKRFTVCTDHSSLKWLQSFHEPEDLPPEEDNEDQGCVLAVTDSWMPSWTHEELAAYQRQDPDLKQVIKWLRLKPFQRKTPLPAPCAPMQLDPVERPLQRVAMDILGPLAETGKRETKQLHSDQGRNFESGVIKGICELLQVKPIEEQRRKPEGEEERPVNREDYLDEEMFIVQCNVPIPTDNQPDCTTTEAFYTGAIKYLLQELLPVMMMPGRRKKKRYGKSKGF
eukprot:Em0507g3a